MESKNGQTVFIHQDHEFCNAINARLERLYYLDGRDNPEHKHHHTYTGLAEKFGGVPSPRSQNLST